MRRQPGRPSRMSKGMIIPFRLNDICCDCERPHFFSSETDGMVFLTPEQSSLMPIHKFKFEFIFDSEYSPEQNIDTFVTFSFDATKISEFFPPLCKISYFQHLGMLTFAMGTHNRLGAGSALKTLDSEILRMIGRYAGGY